jgi:PAS domain S-box-containing protein
MAGQTEKWRSEQLSEALTDEERFQLLVNAVTDYAIYMLDASGNVASWNAGAERFKGYTASEIIGRHFSTFYTEEDIQRRRLRSKLPRAPASSRPKGGGFARMSRGSGRMSSSTPSEARRARCWGSPRSRGTSPSGGRPRKRFFSRRRWTRSAS